MSRVSLRAHESEDLRPWIKLKGRHPKSLAWDNRQVSTAQTSELFRKLPSVNEVLRLPEISPLTLSYGHAITVNAARSVLSRLRQEIASGLVNEEALEMALSGLTGAVEKELRGAMGYSLRAVINATGVVLHTNLGRAPLSKAAIGHVRDTAANYCNLEVDLEGGSRGNRDVHVERLLSKLLSATSESSAFANVATIAVNNNAAAVLLALNTLAEGGEVIVSRGELVEIGGSFRIPDVMAKSGAILREVGTTNRTRIADYENAIDEKTRLLLRVHRSNFEITGFTEQPSIEDLVQLGRRRGISVMEDQGSGALFDLRSVGVNGESSVLDGLRAGVDVLAYSGDKLLGGPQAGLISGRPDLIARMRANSLFRALRVDKLIYAALEATLLDYLREDHDAIPALRMMRLSEDEIGRRGEQLRSRLNSPAMKIEIVDGESLLGGGTAPSAVLPTRLLAVSRDGLSADEIAVRLRAWAIPIVARVEDGRVMLDLRTVFPEQDELIAEALDNIAARDSTS